MGSVEWPKGRRCSGLHLDGGEVDRADSRSRVEHDLQEAVEKFDACATARRAAKEHIRCHGHGSEPANAAALRRGR